MFGIGRVCMKIVGRDAGKKCVVIDVVDQHFVIIDGQTRRRRCNIKHLEPLAQVVKVTKNAPAPEVARALNEIGILVEEKKPKAKAAKAKVEKPVRMHKKKEKPVKETKAKTKLPKEAKKKTEKTEIMSEEKADAPKADE